MNKDVYTAGDISRICRASRKSVNRWLNNGDLKGYRPTKNSDWRITRKELINFMMNNDIPLDFLKEDKIRILVVDDDTDLTHLFERKFQDAEKYSLEVANSGFSAGVKLEQFKPDLIILDIYLGDIDGRELFKHIKETPEFKGIKVIGMSGNLTEKEKKALLEMGFFTFIQKPFDFDYLLKTVSYIFKF